MPAPKLAARRPRAARMSPQERRAQLISAAIRVFARRGIGAARPIEVAEEAEVSEATVYTYFPTREALRDAVLQEVGRYYRDQTDRVLDASAAEPLAVRLGRLFEMIAGAVHREPDHARVWLNWGSATREEIWPSFLENEARTVRRVVAEIEAADPAERAALVARSHPEDLARLLIGACETMARRILAGRSEEEVARFVRSAQDVLFGDPEPADRGAAPSGRS